MNIVWNFVEDFINIWSNMFVPIAYHLLSGFKGTFILLTIHKENEEWK